MVPVASTRFYQSLTGRTSGWYSIFAMKRVSVSTAQMGKFEGKWIAIDSKNQKIIAVGDTLKDIGPLVSSKKGKEEKIKASALLVPRKDEGPYVLINMTKLP